MTISEHRSGNVNSGLHKGGLQLYTMDGFLRGVQNFRQPKALTSHSWNVVRDETRRVRRYDYVNDILSMKRWFCLTDIPQRKVSGGVFLVVRINFYIFPFVHSFHLTW